MGALISETTIRRFSFGSARSTSDSIEEFRLCANLRVRLCGSFTKELSKTSRLDSGLSARGVRAEAREACESREGIVRSERVQSLLSSSWWWRWRICAVSADLGGFGLLMG